MKISRIFGSIALFAVLLSFFVVPVLGAGGSGTTIWQTLYDLFSQPLNALANLGAGNSGNAQELFYGKILIFLAVFAITYIGLGVFAEKAKWDEKKSKGAIIAMALSIGLMGAFAMPSDMVVSLFQLYGAFVYVLFILLLIGVFGYIFYKLGEGDRKRTAAEVMIFLLIIYLLTNVLFQKLGTLTLFTNATYLKDIITLIDVMLFIGIFWNLIQTFTGFFKKNTTSDNAETMDFLKDKGLPAAKKGLGWIGNRAADAGRSAKKGLSSIGNGAKDVLGKRREATRAKADLEKTLKEMEKLKKELDELKKKPAPTPAEEKKKEDLAEKIEQHVEMAEEIDKALAAEGEKPPESIIREVAEAKKDAETALVPAKLTPQEVIMLNKLKRYFYMCSYLKESCVQKYIHGKMNDPKKLKEIGKKYHAMYSTLFEGMYDQEGRVVGITGPSVEIFSRLVYSYKYVESFLTLMMNRTPAEIETYVKARSDKIMQAEASINEAANILSEMLNRKMRN